MIGVQQKNLMIFHKARIQHKNKKKTYLLESIIKSSIIVMLVNMSSNLSPRRNFIKITCTPITEHD